MLALASSWAAAGGFERPRRYAKGRAGSGWRRSARQSTTIRARGATIIVRFTRDAKSPRRALARIHGDEPARAARDAGRSDAPVRPLVAHGEAVGRLGAHPLARNGRPGRRFCSRIGKGFDQMKRHFGASGSAPGLWLVQSKRPVADQPDPAGPRVVVGHGADRADALSRPGGRAVLSRCPRAIPPDAAPGRRRSGPPRPRASCRGCRSR